MYTSNFYVTNIFDRVDKLVSVNSSKFSAPVITLNSRDRHKQGEAAGVNLQ